MSSPFRLLFFRMHAKDLEYQQRANKGNEMFDLTPYETYMFLLSIVVFVLLTTLFVILFSWIMKLLVRGIRNGLEDEKIRKDYKKYSKKKPKAGWFDVLITVFFCVIAFGSFAFSTYTSIYADNVTKGVPLYRVVLSSSMAEKHEDNHHLFEHNLNDQFDQFSLILTHELPKEEDLKLYDIVVYEVDDTLVVHRIVGIEEANEKHPEERWFLLQGDAVASRDRFPVKYEQMKAIYRGQSIPFVGSFVAFMQSPAGYFCILLILFGVIAIPYMENKLYKERKKRLLFMTSAGVSTVVGGGNCEGCAGCPYCEYSYDSSYISAYTPCDCSNCPYNAQVNDSAEYRQAGKKRKK